MAYLTGVCHPPRAKKAHLLSYTEEDGSVKFHSRLTVTDVHALLKTDISQSKTDISQSKTDGGSDDSGAAVLGGVCGGASGTVVQYRPMPQKRQALFPDRPRWQVTPSVLVSYA